MQVLPWHPLGRFLRSPVHVSGHGFAINHCMAHPFPHPLVFFSCLLSWKTAWHGAGKPEGRFCFCPCLKLLSNIKNNCVPVCGPLAGLLAVYPVICFHSIVPPAFFCALLSDPMVLLWLFILLIALGNPFCYWDAVARAVSRHKRGALVFGCPPCRGFHKRAFYKFLQHSAWVLPLFRLAARPVAGFAHGQFPCRFTGKACCAREHLPRFSRPAAYAPFLSVKKWAACMHIRSGLPCYCSGHPG